jgi:DNA-binding NarL/FixJ family response regulator/DNA-binding SARP family transcriptional activator
MMTLTEETCGERAIKVLVVDDDRIVLDGLTSILRDAGYAVFQAGSGERALDIAATVRPQLVIMDVLMPGMSGIDATKLITESNPAARVLVMSVADSPEMVRAAVKAGASGYMTKAATSSELLLDALRRTAEGEGVFIPTLLADAVEDESANLPLDADALTGREREIAALAAKGTANSEIASALAISPRTVENHLARVYKKLHVASRTELARMAIGQRIDEYPWSGQSRAILLVDVLQYSARSNHHQAVLRKALSDIFSEAFARSGMPWPTDHMSDRGNGILVVFPPSVPVTMIADHFLGALNDSLRRYNSVAMDALKMQLRVALDVGPVMFDDLGISGATVMRATRLLDAEGFTSASRWSSSNLAVIVSEPVYDTAVRGRKVSLNSTATRPVGIDVKDGQATAWMWFSGNAVLPGARPNAPAGRTGNRPRFRLLGPLEVKVGDEWQSVGAHKWRSLLATLLLNSGRVVSVDSLADAIWGDEPPAKAANLVSIYVLRLRRLLGDTEGRVLVTRAPGYFVRIEPNDLDSTLFESLLAEGKNALDDGEPARAVELLHEALMLWRGDALADLPPSPYIASESERLGSLRLAATELRIEADMECGRYFLVIPELRGLLTESPLNERAWALLVRALDGDGRRTEALEAYSEAREAIADQLGVDPGAELQRLHHDLLSAQSVSREPRERPLVITGQSPTPGSTDTTVPLGPVVADTTEALDEPVQPTGSVDLRPKMWPAVPSPAQLPADIGDFTGRTELVEHLCGLLSARDATNLSAALVVVAGAGGLGKTSLAVHAAYRLRDLYPDGQLYVDLLGSTPHPQAPADVLARFLRDLRFESSQIPADIDERAALYRTRLAGRRILILLDNARDADQVRPLLPGNSTCAVVVTARSRMPDLASTRLVDLEVLDDDESLTLLTRIVGEQRVAAEPEATADVLIACAGLPLAIRICAARLAARSRWSIQTLAERLRARLLDELRVGDLAVRASFQMSFDSLPTAGDPRRAFRLLGLWQGPFISLQAAAALLGLPVEDAADAVETLVDVCLLESPAPDHYRFHDLLRIYAAERALTEESGSDREAALDRLLTWYLHSTDAAAQMVAPQRTPPPVPRAPADVRPLTFAHANEAMDWLETERGNFVAATRQAAEFRRDDIAWLLPASAMGFFNRRGYHSDWITTHEIALSSVRRIGDVAGEAHILNNLGMAYGDLDPTNATGYFLRALEARRTLGDVRGEAQTMSDLLYTYLRWGHYSEVAARHTEALDSQHRAGSLHGEGVVLSNLAEAYLALGQADNAIRYLRQARRIFPRQGR